MGTQHFLFNEFCMHITPLEFRSIQQGQMELNGGRHPGDRTFREGPPQASQTGRTILRPDNQLAE
jgi:hypothetical protein